MILDQGFVDANGRHITGLDAVIMEGKAREGGGDPTIYLHDHGVQRWAVYQPIERYWAFQAIETVTFVALASTCCWHWLLADPPPHILTRWTHSERQPPRGTQQATHRVDHS